MESTKSTKGTQGDDSTAKREFLKLLVRCRRIILQDTAARLHKQTTVCIVDNPVFSSPASKELQKDVAVALDNPGPDPLHANEQLITSLVQGFSCRQDRSGLRQRQGEREVQGRWTSQQTHSDDLQRNWEARKQDLLHAM